MKLVNKRELLVELVRECRRENMRRVIKQKETLLQPIRLITLTNPSSAAAEHYRTIRTNIQFVSINDQQVKTIVVTSSGPGEGKSTTAANLAVVFAKAGQKVLLVDADMRKPVIYKAFQINNHYGLSNLLSSTETISKGIQKNGNQGIIGITKWTDSS